MVCLIVVHLFRLELVTLCSLCNPADNNSKYVLFVTCMQYGKNFTDTLVNLLLSASTVASLGTVNSKFSHSAVDAFT